MRKHLVTGALGLAVLILNPFYACHLGPSFTYSAKDMKAAVEGTWTLTVEHQTYSFHIKQSTHDPMQKQSSRSLVPSANACGTRSFVATASACIDFSRMPLVVTLTGETTDGVFIIEGTTFREGNLVIEVAGHQIDATVAPDGTATVEGGGKLVRTQR